MSERPREPVIAVMTEIDALAMIVRGFECMPPEAHDRTLGYLTDRYGVRHGRGQRPPAAPRPSEAT